MAAGDIALSILINGNASGAIMAMASVVSSGMGAKAALAAVGVVGAAAVIGLGVAAVKMAADFQSGLTTLVTGAGESQKNLKMVGDGILQISTDTGQSTKSLTDAMYQIESSGIHGSDALNVLKASAQGAAVGNADLKTVAGAVVTTLTDYHMPASKAVDVTNALVTATADGRMKMQDLSSALGNVLPLASSLGVKLPDVSGAIATMTNAGMSAQRSSMDLANALRALGAPGSAAQKSMTEVGISAQQLHDVLGTQGLGAALQMIEDHISQKFPAGSVQAVNAFKSIMGGATGYNVALMLGGQNMSTYESNVKSISTALNSGAKDVQGWALVQGDLNTQLARAQASIAALGIKIGETLLPVVTQIAKAFADFIAGLVNGVSGLGNLTDAFSKNQAAAILLSTALGALAGAMVKLAIDGIVKLVMAIPELVSGLVDVAVSAWAAVGPFALVGAAIAAVIVIFVLLYKNVAPFREFVDGIVNGLKEMWTWFVQQIQPALTDLGNTIKNAFIPVWQQLADAWKNEMLPALKQLWDALQPLAPVLKFLAEGVLMDLVIVLVVVTAAIVGLLKAAAALAQGLATVLGGAIKVVTGLVEELSGVLSAVFDIITGHWDKVGDDLKTVGDGIKTQLGGAWQMLVGIFQGVWNAIASYAQGVGGTIIGPLEQAWNGFKSWWGQFWNDDIVKPGGQAFSDLGTLAQGVAKAIGGFFDGMGTHLHDFWQNDVSKPAGQAFSDLGTIAHNGLNAVVGFFVTGFQEIGGQFTWLYNHNYYIKDLCDAIKNGFATAIGAVESAWNGFGGWWTKFWTNDITQPAGKAFSDLGTLTHNAITTIGGLFDGLGTHLHDFWTNDITHPAGQAFSDLGTTAQSAVKAIGSVFDGIGTHLHDFWNDDITQPAGQAFSDLGSLVKNAMGSIGSAIGQACSALGTQLSDFFNGIGKQAFDWGANLISQFIAGIGSKFSDLGSEVNKIASQISNLLGFHSPTKEGPGSTADKWAPALVNMLSQGLLAGVPQIQSASSKLAGGIGSAFSLSGNNNAFALPSPGSGSANGQGTYNFTVELDGKTIASAVEKPLVRNVRIKGGYHGA